MYNNLLNQDRYGNVAETFNLLKNRLSDAYSMEDIDKYNNMERGYGYGSTLNNSLAQLKNRLSRASGSEGTGANRSILGARGLNEGLLQSAGTMGTMQAGAEQRKADILKSLIGRSEATSAQGQGISMDSANFNNLLEAYKRSKENFAQDREWMLEDEELGRTREGYIKDWNQYLKDKQNSWWKGALGLFTGGISKLGGAALGKLF